VFPGRHDEQLHPRIPGVSAAGLVVHYLDEPLHPSIVDWRLVIFWSMVCGGNSARILKNPGRGLSSSGRWRIGDEQPHQATRTPSFSRPKPEHVHPNPTTCPIHIVTRHAHGCYAPTECLSGTSHRVHKLKQPAPLDSPRNRICR
jgi:hypothetical protein